MNHETPIIYVLDDDYRVREALSSLFLSMGHRVEVFASAAEYLVFKNRTLRRAWFSISTCRA